MAQGMFVRKASGLIRTIGPMDAFVICLAAILPCPFQMDYMEIQWPGLNIIWLMTICAIPLIFHALTYSYVGTAMPRSGGDYVLVGRTIDPSIGFMTNFTLMFFSGIVLGSMFVWFATTFLFGLFSSLGGIYSISWLSDLGGAMTTPFWRVAIGTIGIIGCTIIMCLSLKWIIRIMRIGQVVAIAGVILSIVVLAIATPHDFVTQWDKFYAVIVPAEAAVGQANKAGWTQAPYTFGATMSGLVMGLWFFFGYFVTQYFGGEVKNVSKTLLLSQVGSLVFLAVLYIIWAIVLGNSVGYPINNALNYLYYNTGMPLFPTASLFTTVLQPNLFVIFLTWFGWFFALLTLFLSYYLFISRCMFAWSFDRIMPQKLAYVNERFHSPVVAVLAVSVLAEVGLIVSNFTELLVQFNFALIAAIMFSITTFAATIFPYRMKNVFEAAPGFVKARIRGIPVLSIIGGIACVFMIYMCYAVVTYPAIGGFVTPVSMAFVVVTFVGAGIYYFIIRKYRISKQGIDIRMVAGEIPPS